MQHNKTVNNNNRVALENQREFTGLPIFKEGFMEKIIFFSLMLIGTAVGSFFYGHEFGMIEGERYLKKRIYTHNQRLQSCIGVITGEVR